MNMNIDKEMKIWEERSNDEFGKILRTIKEVAKDYFAAELNECGLYETPLDAHITYYAVYGNRKYVYANIKNTLEDWDILGNDEAVESLVKDLEKFI